MPWLAPTTGRSTEVPRDLDRTRVLAHRMIVQHLASPVDDAAACGVLRLGIQDTPAGSGLTGLGARTTQQSRSLAGLLDLGGPLAVVMATRGAPHVVARSELPVVRAALFPVDEQEADEIDEVSRAMRDIADGIEISRPALSEALNHVVADSLRSWCDRCMSRHVREGLFRSATLQAGLEIDPATASPTTFRPSGSRLPTADHEQARAELARRYVHFTGAARPADLAAWLGRKPGDVRGTWDLLADELAPCVVAGRRRWTLASDADLLAGSLEPAGARLLPPNDPYLLGDRSLVVPERERQRELWRAQASPGAVLVNGEIVGSWRHRMSGNRLRITLSPFDRLSTAVTRALTREAERIAAHRSASRVDVTSEAG